MPLPPHTVPMAPLWMEMTEKLKSEKGPATKRRKSKKSQGTNHSSIPKFSKHKILCDSSTVFSNNCDSGYESAMHTP